MAQQRTKVMVAGHICLDMTPRFYESHAGGIEELLTPGKLVNVDQTTIATGGAVSNTGLAFSRLGFEVALNGKVGNDTFGDLIKKLVGIEHAGSFSTVAGQSSSYSIVLSLPGVDRVFLHHTGTNDTFGCEDIDAGVLTECALFHFGYPSLMKRMYQDGGRELVKMFALAKSLGVMTSLDMTLPDPHSDSGKVDWAAILQKVLPYVDFFLPSVEEIAYMLDPKLFNQRKSSAGSGDPVLAYTPDDCSRLADRLIDMGVGVVAIKNGIRGLYLKTANAERIADIGLPGPSQAHTWADRELWAASYRADTFGSATGAGDVTIAGFLAAVVKGLEPVESLKIANTVGWQNVRNVDAVSGIEDWPTTLSMARDKTRPLNPLNIDQSGWWYDRQDHVYCGPAESQKEATSLKG